MGFPTKELSAQDRELLNARRRAVSQAWAEERKAVMAGKGSRDWTQDQQNQIIKNGRVHDYEGHHMRSVSYGKTYDEKLEIAGDKNNIQFLESSKENNEHLAAHNGDTHNPTNGYYNVKTGKMESFGENAPKPPKKENLSNPIKKENKQVDEYGVEIKQNEEQNSSMHEYSQKNEIKR